MNLINDLKMKKPIFGLDVSMKMMKNNKASIVYISSNSPKKSRLELLSKTSGIKLIELKENSRELGIICKKSFPVSVISFE